MRRGCLFFLVGLVILLGVLGWLANTFVIQPARALVQDFRQLVQLESKVQRQEPYRPPASGQLSPSQVQRLLRVQRAVKEGLGSRYAAIEARLRQLSDRFSSQQQLDYRAALDLFRDSGALILDAKRIQVEGLNAQGFTLEEYRWVRSQVYGALELGLPRLDPQKLLSQIASGDFNPQTALEAPPSSPANRKLVQPYAKELRDFYAFTWFGL
ncbi:hypothetical protein Mrose_02760 [Calidithermus roseus]|uniref:Uncharacterized protein n=1 Tax=Calidithermus roseus TaxID=1644118 RepID=A0A399EL35_9DEIN|nr:hypothetical protein Mrose_02760 [Calidithermus roseus]